MQQLNYLSQEEANAPDFNVSAHEGSAYLSIDRDYPPELRSQFTKGNSDTLSIRYMPEEISVSGGDPSWNEIEVIGRWEPYQVFGGTSSEQITMSLQFFAEYNVLTEVKRRVDWLRSFKYPVYYNKIMYKPPRLHFVWGDLINTFVILKEASPTYRKPWFVDVPSESNVQVTYPLLPMAAEVSLTLIKVSDTPISGPDIMNGLR